MAATSSSLSEHIPGLGLIRTSEAIAQWRLEEQAAQQNQQPQAMPSVTQNSFTPAPVPVQQSVRSSENTILLYQLAIKHGIDPKVEFPQADQKFRGQLKLGAASFTTENLYNNKKDAKEAVAKLGVDYLKDLPVVHTTSPKGASGDGISNVSMLAQLTQKHALLLSEWIFTEVGPQQFTAKMKVQDSIFEAGPCPNKKEAKEASAKQAVSFIMAYADDNEEAAKEDELWTAKLYTFLHASTGKGPEYADFGIGRLFSCEVTIPQRQDRFGDKSVPFGSKKKARNNAAKEAVEWLRSEGLMDEEDKPVKKTKSQSQSQSSEEGTPPSSPTKGDGKGYMQQLMDFCQNNGLSMPKPKLEQSGSFYSGAIYFPNNPRINKDQPVGQVNNIFGKKNAKEEMGKEALRFVQQYVREIRERTEKERLEREEALKAQKS